jgi:acetylornithine deacetylase
VLVGLEELDQTLRASPGHALLGTGSLHASLIEGGQERSSYPATCRLAVERRTIPGETTAQVVTQMQSILDRRTAADPATRAALELVMERPSFAIEPDASIVTALKASIQNITGASAALVGAPFWMDSAILSAAGIPTVIFGPSGTGAHAEVEWVELASVERCADVLTSTARSFCV